jgi:hypothetical protein
VRTRRAVTRYWKRAQANWLGLFSLEANYQLRSYFLDDGWAAGTLHDFGALTRRTSPTSLLLATVRGVSRETIRVVIFMFWSVGGAAGTIFWQTVVFT